MKVVRGLEITVIHVGHLPPLFYCSATSDTSEELIVITCHSGHSRISADNGDRVTFRKYGRHKH